MLPDLAFTSDDPATAIGNEQMMYLLLKRLENLNIMDSTVLTALLADGGVSTAKLADLAVTNAKIGDLAVQTAKIGDLQVTTLKIAGEGVTTPKRQLVNSQTLTQNVLANEVKSFTFSVSGPIQPPVWRCRPSSEPSKVSARITLLDTSNFDIAVWNEDTVTLSITVEVFYW